MQLLLQKESALKPVTLGGLLCLAWGCVEHLSDEDLVMYNRKLDEGLHDKIVSLVIPYAEKVARLRRGQFADEETLNEERELILLMIHEMRSNVRYRGVVLSKKAPGEEIGVLVETHSGDPELHLAEEDDQDPYFRLGVLVLIYDRETKRFEGLYRTSGSPGTDRRWLRGIYKPEGSIAKAGDLVVAF